MRKAIATTLTVISQNQRTALREAYKNKVSFADGAAQLECIRQRYDHTKPCTAAKSTLYLQKFLPLDLRPKKTRAIRRRLTKHQVSNAFSMCIFNGY